MIEVLEDYEKIYLGYYIILIVCCFGIFFIFGDCLDLELWEKLVG